MYSTVRMIWQQILRGAFRPVRAGALANTTEFFQVEITIQRSDMRRTFTAWISVLALAGCLATPVVAGPRPTPPAQGGQQGAKRAERHPEIRQAMRALQRAKDALQEGAHDFSGHRAKALELTNQALEECRAALQADKN